MENFNLQNTKTCHGLGSRHVIAALSFLVLTIIIITRVSISVSIVAMTTANEYGYEVFEWDEKTQNIILSSFYWGYAPMQLPGGIIAARLGAKIPLFLASLLNGIICLLIPFGARTFGSTAVYSCRILIGLSQGLIYPTINGLLSQWSPSSERGRMLAFVYSGSQLGVLLSMMLSGVLSSSKWGWPSPFYVFGSISVIISLVWLYFGSSSPSQCSYINEEELEYILEHNGSSNIEKVKKTPTPWLSILTSKAFLLITITDLFACFGSITLATKMPTYINKVLKVDVRNSGVLSSLPYIAYFVFNYICSWMADMIINKNIVSRSASRKIFNTISYWGSGAFLLALAFTPSGHFVLTITLLVCSVGLTGADHMGISVSLLDISPNHSSAVMGLCNAADNFLSLAVPLLITAVVPDETSISDWRKVFFISVSLTFIGNLIFILFFTSEVQPWNEVQTNSTDKSINLKKIVVKSKKTYNVTKS